MRRPASTGQALRKDPDFGYCFSMPAAIHVIYQDGVLKPTRKLRFKEDEEVVLKVVSEQRSPARPPRSALALVGVFDGPKNLSRDPDRHLYGKKRKTG